MKCCGIRPLAVLSGLVTIAFLCGVVLLFIIYLQRDVTLFVISVSFCLEAIVWFKYIFDVGRTNWKPKWHLKRLPIPLIDLTIVVFNCTVAFNVFQWNAINGGFLENVESLETNYKILLGGMVGGVLIKGFCAFHLVREHYTVIRGELSSRRTEFINMHSLPSGYNFPATAPILDNDSDRL